jgi:uncharacterized membrane protein
MFIGRLGWLDIALPAYAYLCGGVLLVAGTLVCIIERISNSIWDRVFILASFSVVLLLMLWTFYLAWTPVGAATIIGMQGRYLFAIIPLLITITPSFELRNKRLAEMLTASLAVLCVGIVVFLAIISLREVRQHYRIAGRTTSFIQLSLSISEIQKR